MFAHFEPSNKPPIIKEEDDDPYSMGRTKSRSFTSAIARPAFGRNINKVESLVNLLDDKDDNTS